MSKTSTTEKIINLNSALEPFSDMLEMVIFNNSNVAQNKAFGEKGIVIAVNAK